MCSKAGFAFAGLQYGVECFCGHSHLQGDKRYKPDKAKLNSTDFKQGYLYYHKSDW